MMVHFFTSAFTTKSTNLLEGRYIMKSYIRQITEYTFSNTPADPNCPINDMFRSEIAGIHGVAGKFMEKIIRERFGIDVWGDDKIHDHDGSWWGRPVEIKLETINNTNKLGMLSSYGKPKKLEYQEQLPLIINAAMDPNLGKLMWVAITDTAKLTDDSALWEALSKDTPRTGLSNYSDEDLRAIKIPYVNSEVCYTYSEAKFTGDKGCIGTRMFLLLEELCGL